MFRKVYSERSRTKIVTILIAAILCGVCQVQAEFIKIGLIGQVDYIDDPYNLLENKVNQGDLITGFYIYDSATPDSNPDICVGEYKYTSTPYGMLLTVGCSTFQADPTNVDFMIGITNGIESGGGGDNYWVVSRSNLFFNNDVYIERLLWQLVDYSYMAISSTELPDVPPDLSKWPYNNLYVSGGRGGMPPCFDETFQIGGYITSTYLIPEPTTIILLAIGALALNRRSFKKD